MGLLLLALLPAGLTVSLTTTQVRYGAGLVLLIESAEGGDYVRVVDRGGQVIREIYPSRALRRAFLYDAVAVNADTVAVAASSPGTLTRAMNRILVYGPTQESSYAIDTGTIICQQIAPQASGGFWCLGPNFDQLTKGTDYASVHDFSADGRLVGSYLPRSWFPTVNSIGEPAREPFQMADIGPPQLLPRGSDVVVWSPAGNLLALVQAGKVQRREMPLRRVGRSTVSLALAADGVLYGLFPELTRGQTETFLTPYALYRLRPNEHQWNRMTDTRTFPRGTYLVGTDSGQLVVWHRSSRRVDWLSIAESTPPAN